MPDALSTRKSSSIPDRINFMQNLIARRAYDIFERNGCVPGQDLDNWLQAERELIYRPAAELSEKDGQLQLEVALSGVDPKDIDVEVSPEDIAITASSRHVHSSDKGEVHSCEFQAGEIFRTFHLPKKIDPDKVKAEFRNGLLRLNAQIAEQTRTAIARSEAA